MLQMAGSEQSCGMPKKAHGDRPMKDAATATACMLPSMPATLTATCSTCHLKDVCLPCDMEGSEVERLDKLRFGRRKVAAGDALYSEGDRFFAIHAVRSGSFKSSLALRDGREQV